MLTLDQLKVGERGQIISIDSQEQFLYRKLLNLGFFPGCEVQVLQVLPAFLVQVGFTQMALDRQTCHRIAVMMV